MSELTDLEICKRIAEIEGFDYQVIEPLFPNRGAHIAVGDNLPRTYNPLTDKALCFELMVKHQIQLDWDEDKKMAFFIYKPGRLKRILGDCEVKIICLAIIAQHEESE